MTTVDQDLRANSCHESTPDVLIYFKRYQIAAPNIEIETYNGKLIDNLGTWTLQDHFDLFGVK
jgi:hypothetical protein